MKNRLIQILGFSGLTVGIALMAWGQPMKERPPQTDLTGDVRILPHASELTSLDHYRCEKQNDGRYRFVSIEDKSSPSIVLSCVNCSCEGEK